MADRGYRSIEVSITNQTSGDLSVQGASLKAGCMWVQGEGAKPGDILAQYNSVTWGVMTDDLDGPAAASIALHGLGRGPVTVELAYDPAGTQTCQIEGNTAVSAGPVTWQSGAENHVAASVDLADAGVQSGVRR